jgi:predicted esterase/glutathione S-transferase
MAALLQVPAGAAGYPPTDGQEQGLARRARHDEWQELAPRVQDSGDSTAASTKPCLHYFPYAGRGELTRLIAAVGGVEIDEVSDSEDSLNFGSPGTLPLLAHGKLKVAQSFAIESYIANIAPAFANLDASQRALDHMFCKIKEDVLQDLDEAIGAIGATSSDESRTATAAQDVAAIGDKWFAVIEGRLPETGFIHGLDIPTAADLAVFNMAEARVPFEASYKLVDYDISAKFPKFAAHVARVREHPSVKAYVEKSATFAADLPASGQEKPSAAGKAQAQKISALAEETASLWHAVDCPVPDAAVVWLHGLGETEVYWQELFDDADLTHLRELGECRWIMPRAEPAPCTVRGGALTLQWFDTSEYPVCLIVPGVPDRLRKDENPREIHAAVHRVHEAVLALEVEGTPAERIVVAGFGQGGALAVHAALSYPKTLAGCAMLSGYVPCCKTALKDAITPAGSATEVLWLHGIHDAVVHVDAASAQAKDLTELGVRLDFRLSFDYGHETTEDELKAFRSWLISKMAKPPQEQPVYLPPQEQAAEEQLAEGNKVEVKPSYTYTARADPWSAIPRVSC